MSEQAKVGEVYEFPPRPAAYPAAAGYRYEIYDRDERFGLLIGRNLTDPGAVDIHGSPEAWPLAASRIEPEGVQ